MMKHLAIALTLLLPGSAHADCTPLKARNVNEVHVTVENALIPAITEYFFGDPKNSVVLLEQLIAVYMRTQCTPAAPEELRSAFQYEELQNRGRLARQYRLLGEAARATLETKRAVKLGRAVLRNPSWTETDLTNLIERLDANIREDVRAGKEQREARKP